MPKMNRNAVLRGAASYLAILVVAGMSGFSGYIVGRRSVGAVPLAVTNPANKVGATVDFSTFWQAWNAIDTNFYGSADNQKRLDGAISGMAASLGDPYTLYLPKSQSEQFQSDLQGSFGGIGAELEVKDGQLTVIAPLDGTPSDKAGIKSGDIIAQIDGKKTDGMNFSDAVAKIRGDVGTKVVLTIVRQGEEQPLTVTVTRDTVVVKSVKTDSIGANKDIAYIKVNQFGSDTADLFKQALKAAVSSGKKGAVIDLRNNPGGYLDTAASMIGMVIPDTVTSDQAHLKSRIAVEEKDKQGRETDHTASSSAVAPTLPMVVLVNSGSASASEIFAGAMKDYGRATVMGTQSFGKGSVQTLLPLSSGGSMKVTIAKWFTPLGVGIDGKGITPDVIATLPKDAAMSATDDQASQAVALLQE